MIMTYWLILFATGYVVGTAVFVHKDLESWIQDIYLQGVNIYQKSKQSTSQAC